MTPITAGASRFRAPTRKQRSDRVPCTRRENFCAVRDNNVASRVGMTGCGNRFQDEGIRIEGPGANDTGSRGTRW
ncbi:MAG: hypothetical protein M3Q48_11340 [Actinomycetota bacterium]|nr:hypothetical protein [Actinomycetota bacterium]